MKGERAGLWFWRGAAGVAVVVYALLLLSFAKNVARSIQQEIAQEEREP